MVAVLPAFSQQPGQIDLTLLGHFQQRLGRPRVIGIFRETAAALDPFPHILKGVIAHMSQR